MSLPFTSVVSYHMNPMTCGVAKFSTELARRLGVPFLNLRDVTRWGYFPLFSLKWSELPVNLYLKPPGRYGVFWHDAGDASIEENAKPAFVCYADPSLGSPGLWCPSLLTPSRKRPVRLFSFGMAHKLQADKYRRVRELLDAAGERYHLRVSVGIHEGTSLDDATTHFDALKDIMGPDHVTILGILSDDAVAEELANCDYVLAFFEKGLRANNTTVHAALAAGCRVISNHDHTPDYLRMVTWDIGGMQFWDTPWSEWGFEALVEQMKGLCDRSRLAHTL